MDELPFPNLPNSNRIFDNQTGRTYTIRLANGRINPRASLVLVNRYNQSGALRRNIIDNFLNPNGLRVVGNNLYDIRSQRGVNLYRNALRQQRDIAIAERNAQRRLGDIRRATRNILVPLRRRNATLPIYRREFIDRINERTRIFRFIYSFNGSNDDWVGQVNHILNQTAYLENLPNFNTRTQVIMSSLPANTTIDSHLSMGGLRTAYLDSGISALNNIITKKATLEQDYDDEYDWDIDTIIVNRILTPLGGQGGGRSEGRANKTWLMMDKKSKTNCFFNTIGVISLFHKKQQETDNQYEIRIRGYLDDTEKTMKTAQRRGTDTKRAFNHPITNLVDLGMIKQFTDWKYSQSNTKNIYIQLYNNIFEKTHLILPSAIQNEVDAVRNDNNIDISQKPKVIQKILDRLTRYEIQLINNHYIPLIRWRDMKLPPPSAPVSPVNTDEEEEEDYIIQKYNNKKNKDTGEWEKIIVPYDDRFMAYDLEATPNGCENGDFTTFLSSLVWKDRLSGEKIKKSWVGLDACKQLVDFIAENIEVFNGYTIYAHNNGKFDMIQMFKDYILSDTTCPLKINPDKLIPLNGAYIGVSLYNEGGEIDFKDSLKMLPSSLDRLGIEFDVEHKKLGRVELPNGEVVEIDHNDINIDNWDRYDIIESQKIYCEQDSMCLFEILEIFSKDVYEATGINITDCFTGASLSKKHYYKNYYKRFKTPLYHLTKEKDRYIRNSYYGGRNEAHYIGKYNHKVYYYDFTSLYPSEGRKKLPYGKPIPVEYEVIQSYNILSRPNFNGLPFGFYRVKVKTIDKNRKPLHAIKNEGRLTFPIFENPTEITLFSEEIKLGKKNKQYQYEFLDGIVFKNSKFMCEFFEDGFSRKGQAKADGKPALAQVYKIIINSGYGFFGLNTLGRDGEGRDGVAIYPKDTQDFWDLLNSGGLVNIGKCGDYNIVRMNKELEITDFNVGVASAITSWARIRIWNFIDDIEKKGGKILYMDTDSAIIDISMKAHQDIMDKYCWDGDGSELGSMKNEADDEVMDYFKGVVKREHPDWNKDAIKNEAKSRYAHQEELDGGDLHWDRFIGSGCKQYALQKILYDGGVVEICKMKGYSKKYGRKLKFDDFVRLTKAYWKQKSIEAQYQDKCKEMLDKIKEATNPDIITQDQVQFRTPLSYHLTSVRVEKWSVKKEFRTGYSKGIVGRDGWVKPLTL